jgi:sarcosine oxidase/L-pipecolate oxidase
VEYQDLAFSGRPIWLEWNKAIATTPAQDLPKGLTPDTTPFVPCGLLKFSIGETLSEYDQDCLDELEKAGLRHWQHVTVSRRHYLRFYPHANLSLQHQSDQKDLERYHEYAKSCKDQDWDAKLNLQRSFQGGTVAAFVDTGAGLTYADKVSVIS